MTETMFFKMNFNLQRQKYIFSIAVLLIATFFIDIKLYSIRDLFFAPVKVTFYGLTQHQIEEIAMYRSNSKNEIKLVNKIDALEPYIYQKIFLLLSKKLLPEIDSISISIDTKRFLIQKKIIPTLSLDTALEQNDKVFLQIDKTIRNDPPHILKYFKKNLIDEYSLINWRSDSSIILKVFATCIRTLLLLLFISLIVLNSKRFNLLLGSGLQVAEVKTSEIMLSVVLIFSFFIIAISYNYFCAVVLNKPYPYNTFLFLPTDRFNDFYNLYNITKNNNPYFEPYYFTSNYYPFANILFYVFTFFPQKISFFVYIIGFIFFSILFSYHNLKSKNKFLSLLLSIVIVFFSYPFLFVIDRGNIETYLYIFLCLFFIFHFKNKSILSSLFLAITITMKAYPIVFIIFLFAQRRYKEIAFTILFTIIITFLCILTFKEGFLNNALFIFNGFGINDNILGTYQRGTTLMNILKLLLLKISMFKEIDKNLFFLPYALVSLLFFLLISFIIVFIEKVKWKQILLLMICILLLPHISCDYKLIHLTIPFFLYLHRDETDTPSLRYVVLFSLLFIPKQYFFISDFQTDSGVFDISYFSFLNQILLIYITFNLIWLAIKKTSYTDILVTFKSYISDMKHLPRILFLNSKI